MTVRVNKGSFNIREKLTELGRRFGLKGSELVAAETVQEARDLVSVGRKNLIINGDMRISQRYGFNNPQINLRRVVLPAPEGPIIATFSPFFMEKFMLFKTFEFLL